MAKKPAPIRDEAGQAWQARANAAWDAAMQATDGDAQAAVAMYSRKSRDATEDTSTLMPVLPAFDEEKHPSVRRPVFGRFVVDQEHQVVHDVYQPKGDCQIDQIASALFFHFGHEVPDDLTRHTCIETG